jgi:hypothetical protein
LLTLNSIKKENTEKNQRILAELARLAQTLNEFLNSENRDRSEHLLAQINQHYENLCTQSQVSTFSIEVGYALINLGSVILATITGILGAFIGGVAGLFRGIATLNNPLAYFADGLITGLSLGAAMGFRAPKKLLKDELTRQLRFCTDALARCLETMQNEMVKPISFYEERIKARLLIDCFAGNQPDLQAFLEAEGLTYQIATVSAQFLSENLEGYLGQHARIIIPLPNQEHPTLLEFTSDSDEIDDRPFSQYEERRVSGKKLIEMMALHEQLLVTEACTLTYVLTDMKAGDDNDCFSYINKILIGTNQTATSCRRFDGRENWVGRNIIGFFVQNFSPFPQDILDEENTIVPYR